MEAEQALKQEAAWQAQSQRASGAHQDISQVRLATYRPTINYQLQCPRCWIRDGMRCTLRSVNGSNDHDVLKCNHDPCGAEYVVPL